MNVRPASEHDRTGIYETAQRSFEASYALSPQDIETVLENEFSPGAVGGRIDGPGTLFVAETSEGSEEFDTEADVLGFAELDADGVLQWLHVHPEARGRGVGTALVERVRDELESESTPFTARLLEGAREGEQFLERFGLYWTGSTTRDVDGNELDEQVYTTEGTEQDANEPGITVPSSITVDGESRSVASREEVPGTAAPFYLVYEGDDHEQRVGFFCSQCGTVDVSIDSLDRLECNECGNTHRPDDWDSAYL